MHNTDGILPAVLASQIRDSVMGLEKVANVEAFVLALGKIKSPGTLHAVSAVS